MIDRIKDILLQLDVLHLLVLEHDVLPNALHSEKGLSVLLLHEENLTESTFTNHFDDFKVLEIGRRLSISGKYTLTTISHGLLGLSIKLVLA